MTTTEKHKHTEAITMKPEGTKDCVHVPDIYTPPTGTASQIADINTQNAQNARLYRATRFLLRKDFGLDHVPADPKAFLTGGDSKPKDGENGHSLKSLEGQVALEQDAVTTKQDQLVKALAHVQSQQKKVDDLRARVSTGNPDKSLPEEEQKLQDLKNSQAQIASEHDDALTRYQDSLGSLESKRNAILNDHIRFLSVYGLLKADNWDPAAGRTTAGPDDLRLPTSGGQYEIISRPFADALVGAVRDYTVSADLFRKVFDFLRTEKQPS